jgi:ATP-binding cassette subfamily F protein 3
VSLVVLSKVAVEFAGQPIFDDVSLTVSRGERWGIIGRNGTGKTTLFNLITGRLEPTRGSVVRAGALRFTLLDQHRDFSADASVWAAAAQPFAELARLEQSLHDQAARMGELGAAAPADLLSRYDRDLERFAREGGYEFRARVDAVLHGLGFEPESARLQPAAQLSGGEAGRIALARQLVAPADVLLLDEPTNHLDLDTTRWLEEYLKSLAATVLIISHDRAFLQATVDHVLHLEAGSAVAYNGGYDAFLQQRAERRLTQERAYQAQQRMIAAEEEYIRRNIAGQNTRQAKGRRTRLTRVQRLSPPPSEEQRMALRLQPAARGGDQVLVAEDVGLRVGERVLLDGFSNRITRGECIGLIGANGTGKSTLLRAVAGERPVDHGRIQVGESIELAYYRQDMMQVPLGVTLFDIIHDLRPLWQRGQIQAHLGRFGFSGSAVQRLADSLSGGERARVALAMLVLAHANFLLLDEPTNHLDVESIEALEDALEDFDGTVLLVSHDRALLRALVTRVWHLEQGRMVEYPGTFEEWENWQAARLAEAERAAAAQAEQRRRLERAEARKRHEHTAGQRASALRQRRELQQAEAEVHSLEQMIATLRAQLEDPGVYTSADGARNARAWKDELDRLELKLMEAMERWHAASEEGTRDAGRGTRDA